MSDNSLGPTVLLQLQIWEEYSSQACVINKHTIGVARLYKIVQERIPHGLLTLMTWAALEFMEDIASTKAAMSLLSRMVWVVNWLTRRIFLMMRWATLCVRWVMSETRMSMRQDTASASQGKIEFDEWYHRGSGRSLKRSLSMIETDAPIRRTPALYRQLRGCSLRCWHPGRTAKTLSPLQEQCSLPPASAAVWHISWTQKDDGNSACRKKGKCERYEFLQSCQGPWQQGRYPITAFATPLLELWHLVANKGAQWNLPL